MTVQIQLEVGVAPWRGSTDVTVGEVFDFYNMPLAGHLIQNGSDFVFRCLDGIVDSSNTWVYFPVQADELATLKRLDGEEYSEYLFDTLFSRDVIVAVADDYEIVEWQVGARDKLDYELWGIEDERYYHDNG